MAENDLSTLLLRPRHCAADWLIIHARDVAAVAQRFSSANLLVLACLETRNSIEQLWFEILAVLHAGEITLGFLRGVRSRREGFLAAIRDAEPNYRKLVRFSALCMQLDTVRPVDIITWDLRRLKNWWRALSPYCHAQAEPTTTVNSEQWFKDGITLVSDVFSYFEAEMSGRATGILRVRDMNAPARSIWDDFVAGNIDEEQVLIRLQIVRPPRIT